MRRFARLFLLLIIGPGFAADGVYEINTNCVREGCFPGDDPLTETIEIAQVGHYRLTSNIIFSERHGVEFLSGGGGTLDLNGYELLCADNQACQSQNGVQLGLGSLPVTVHGGYISGFRDCIHQDAGQLHVDQMVLRFCADDGLEIVEGIVRNSTFVSNAFGVYTRDAVRVQDNVFYGRNGSQDPGVFNNKSACSGNIIASGTDNDLDSCVALGSNLCETSLCSSLTATASIPAGK